MVPELCIFDSDTRTEEPKTPMAPGSGLCAGFTTTKVILSDALALVRGDRFCTVDYTPHRLTAFGYNEASNDRSIAGGGVMYKLLMRTFRGSHSLPIFEIRV